MVPLYNAWTAHQHLTTPILSDNKINKDIYIKTYLHFFPASEPKDEWDDRNRLYACYFYLWYSVHHKASGKAVRQM